MKLRSTFPTNANCILIHARDQTHPETSFLCITGISRLRLHLLGDICILRPVSCSAPRLCSGSGATHGPRAPPWRRSRAPEPGKLLPYFQKFAESFRLISVTWDDPRFNSSLLRVLYRHVLLKVFQLTNSIQRAYQKPHEILNYA